MMLPETVVKDVFMGNATGLSQYAINSAVKQYYELQERERIESRKSAAAAQAAAAKRRIFVVGALVAALVFFLVLRTPGLIGDLLHDAVHTIRLVGFLALFGIGGFAAYQAIQAAAKPPPAAKPPTVTNQQPYLCNTVCRPRVIMSYSTDADAADADDDADGDDAAIEFEEGRPEGEDAPEPEPELEEDEASSEEDVLQVEADGGEE